MIRPTLPLVVFDECHGCGAEHPSTDLHYTLEGHPWCQACEPPAPTMTCEHCGPDRTVVSTGLLGSTPEPVLSFRLDCGHVVL